MMAGLWDVFIDALLPQSRPVMLKFVCGTVILTYTVRVAAPWLLRLEE